MCDEVENGFRTARFSCSGEITITSDEGIQTQEGASNCRSIRDWVDVAISKCNSFCESPSPSPQISQIPVPSTTPCIGDEDCREGEYCQGWFNCRPGIAGIGNTAQCIYGHGYCAPMPTTNPPPPSRPPFITPAPWELTPTPSPEPQPIWPPFTSYCSTTNSYIYPWQSCP